MIETALDYTFGWEPIADLLDDPALREMVIEQWEELAGNKDIPLEPDTARMKALEEVGYYKAWAARRDGELIGFIEFTITAPLHHKNTLYAFDGGHFMHPEHRVSFLWMRMWRSAMRALSELGVRVVMAHDNPVRPLDVAFSRLGFRPAGQLYVKEI